MAFIYSLDGQRYEDNFHFWYVNGFHPDPELIIPAEESVIVEAVSGSREGGTDSGIIHTRNNQDGPGRLGRKPGWCK